LRPFFRERRLPVDGRSHHPMQRDRPGVVNF
jgi:hypothetical protein